MALRIISSDTSAQVIFSDGTDVTVLPGVTTNQTIGSSILNTSSTYSDGIITILGTVVSAGAGIDFFNFVGETNSFNNTNIFVGATGTVIGKFAIDIEDGAIANPITNYGEIIGEEEAVRISPASANSQGAFMISNFGVMTAAGAEGVIKIGSFHSGNVLNAGLIQAVGAGAVLDLGTDVDVSLNNSGTLFADSGNIFSDAASGTFSVTNSGDILGKMALSDSADTVVNSGLISDDITMAGGADTYRGLGDGVVTGLVDGGAGEDTLVGSDADDSLGGGDDEDRLVGRDGDDELGGGAQDDVIRGGDGNDMITGDGGEDDVRGGNGADIVSGGDEDDVVRGGSGDDRVDGGAGEDDVRGGAGDDEVLGGLGKDQLFGGSGNDIFIFETAADSTNDSNRDFIKDFELGSDLIDLTGLPGTYDFIGDSSFSGTGREVRVTVNSAGNSTVFVDTDGDGTGDSRIIVEGVTGLTEADFLL